MKITIEGPNVDIELPAELITNVRAERTVNSTVETWFDHYDDPVLFQANGDAVKRAGRTIESHLDKFEVSFDVVAVEDDDEDDAESEPPIDVPPAEAPPVDGDNDPSEGAPLVVDVLKPYPTPAMSLN